MAEEDEIGDSQAGTSEKGRVGSTLSKLRSHLLVEFREGFHTYSGLLFVFLEKPGVVCL